MKRDIYKELLTWKSNERRKPLLLKGARQTGKTYILDEFGKNEYENTHYFNFEEDKNLENFFKHDLNPFKIIEMLSIYKKSKIQPEKDLIIFDEIQISNNALNSLKYFNEKANEYHITAAGSLLGVKLSSPKSFPVGKVNFLEIFPMTFNEFLIAIGEERFYEFLNTIKELNPIPETFHFELVKLLRIYYFIGGMPEVVKYYSETKEFFEIRKIQKEIINSFILDFVKHASPSNVPKLTHIWDSIPVQLARENKKFIFSAIKPSARAREYEDAIIWLEDSGLIYRSYLTNIIKQPLKGYIDKNSYKVYGLDVGLLGAMADIPLDILTQEDKFFKEFKGAFVENYTAQQLKSYFKSPLIYWKSEGKKAEIDFLYQSHGLILPLEIKSGINPRSRSLKSFDNQFKPEILLRATLKNLKLNGKILNVPLYAIFCLDDYINLIKDGP